MILSSPHVHTQFCDGKNTAEEMVLSALEHGFQSIGLSSHAKQHFDHQYAMDTEREEAYIREVRRLQKKYEDKIRIWLGTELDLFCCAETGRFDYVIGSLHLIPTADRILGVDNTKERLLNICDDVFDKDGIAMAIEYFRYYGAYIYAQRPHIAGHMDLIRKNNMEGDIFDESDPRYRKAALNALGMVRNSGAIIEVNTGAMARYGAKTPYPDRFLLEEWLNMGGEVILSSDCHRAEHIMTGYAQSVDLLLSIGYKTVKVLGTGNALFETTELKPLR
ncbi:MAG: histidinol-phosphatase [Clostridia bacterium]|nr:histidinol-phosphatase [Clostridia bacterium]